MVGQAVANMMADGRRLHLQHGPIDLICLAEGDPFEIKQAYRAASQFFQDALQSIVDDLPLLRSPVNAAYMAPTGDISAAMMTASHLFAGSGYITPMASVAGAVADAVLAVMSQSGTLSKIVVNNGGDIAFSLAEGECFNSAIVNNPDEPSVNAMVQVSSSDPVRGVATSGWKGRSFSRGIADAVTVLAPNAATADVAATLIANDVFVADDVIVQKPAIEVDANTDLEERMITIAVGRLSSTAKKQALNNGMIAANYFIAKGLIYGAYLALQGEVLEAMPTRNIIREEALCLN